MGERKDSKTMRQDILEAVDAISTMLADRRKCSADSIREGAAQTAALGVLYELVAQSSNDEPRTLLRNTVAEMVKYIQDIAERQKGAN